MNQIMRFNINEDPIEIIAADVRNGHILRFEGDYRNDFNPTNALYLINSGEKIFTRVYGVSILLNPRFFRENRSELNELGSIHFG